MKLYIFHLFLFLIAHRANSQDVLRLADLAHNNKLDVVNRELTPNTDGSIKLNEAPGAGLAWLKGQTFSTGTLELEIKGKDILQKSFVGVAFHGVNDSTYEAVYFRPFNFHSKDSIRRIHAVQYVSHPKYPWYKLRDEHNGVYEKGITPAPDPNGWFHARIDVTSTEVLVYVNRATTPSLRVSRLTLSNDGAVGVWVGEGSGGEFAKFKITK
jgi:hypothetical protein